MYSTFLRSLAGFTLAAWAAHTYAQGTTLPPVTVTGNPLGTDLVTPASRLSGTELLLRSQGSLGETLNAQPGVSSTYFGPTASRPVIRGLDGDRIRLLSNGGASLDVSSLSFDHAVTADPIAVESIEVLRGPAALLYGGNAIGGVVNLIDNRIPRQPAQGFTGVADLGYASAAREKSAAALLEGGNRRLGWHADVFGRRSGSTRVPVELPCTQDGLPVVSRRLCNSDSRSGGGALGGSVFLDHGFLGLAASEYRNEYGSVAEDAVRIDMASRRYAIEGEWRQRLGPFSALKLKASHTDYEHTEFDEGAPGTVFANRGNDLRLEARHVPIGGFEGVIGWHTERARFSADGAEAFAPHSRSSSDALFAYEERAASWGKLTLGARMEEVRVESLGSPSAPRFAPAARRFSPKSLAAGGLWKLTPQWELNAQLARSQRAPKDYELFADGPHVATGAWEVGNPALPLETARQFDLGAQWKRGSHSLRANAFEARFDNYIALLRTGRMVGEEPGDGEEAELLPEFAYTPVQARFRGFELQGTARLSDTATKLDLELRADRVRADNRSTGEPLPRIAPWRAGMTLVAAQGPWAARVGFDHNARQQRVPAGDLATGAYTLWHAAVTWRMEAQGAQWLWFLRVDNATDRLAYSATSILTQTTPGRVPLPGRSVKLGVRASF
jgi:iron complex outermembrane receptor protein